MKFLIDWFFKAEFYSSALESSQVKRRPELEAQSRRRQVQLSRQTSAYLKEDENTSKNTRFIRIYPYVQQICSTNMFNKDFMNNSKILRHFQSFSRL